ncbi:F-box protein At3g07870-like [Camellia sinensis]|uniref:F-box protein At3g07870-like n=1 Tax=Camellia sinensis TaxID=4442 RepID=UPI001035DAE1|nr:F-box protein At3g07870-like [Camellia sinensis]
MQRQGDGRIVIVPFQLANEIFGEIIVPSFDGHWATILAFQHSIALVVQDPAITKWDIRVMKEYGVVNSWTKQYSLGNTIGFPFGSMKNGEILVERRTGNLVSYDPKTQFHRDLKLPQWPYKIFFYMENLALLHNEGEERVY